MKLFEIDETHQVQLNREWMMLIPEFAEIIKRDKGSPGDSRGTNKLRARKEFTFIYFTTDFSSPIRDWANEEREKEALYYAGLEPKDIDEKLRIAQEKYLEMMYKGSRSLRTLKSLYKGLDAMDTQFETDDLFTATDKMGKLKYTVTEFTNDTLKLNKVYDAIKQFETRVEEDLKQVVSGIRGPNSTLGDNEGKKKAWSEADIREGSVHKGGPSTSGTFSDILEVIRQQAAREKAEASATKVPVVSAAMADIFNDDEEDDEL